jgi:predicted secreted protein
MREQSRSKIRAGIRAFACLVIVLGIAGCSSGSRHTPKSGLQIVYTVPPRGMEGAYYSHTFAAAGGTQPYTWSVTGGSLPTGLNLARATGDVTGLPTAAGTFTFTLRVTDSSTSPATAAGLFSIEILPPGGPLQITTSSLPDGSEGQSYGAFLTAIGGTIPYTWDVTAGSLPHGLQITDPVRGEISGTPSAAGTYFFSVRLRDSSAPAPQSDGTDLAIWVSPAAPSPPLPAQIPIQPQGDRTYSKTVSAGQPFTVTAEENPSTGYTWELDAVDPAYLDVIDNRYQSSGGGTGSGGLRIIDLRALQAGSTRMVMTYKQPWMAVYYVRVTIEVEITP